MSNGWCSLLRDGYLANADLHENIVGTAAREEGELYKLHCFMRQSIDAASPTNCAAPYPAVIRSAIESNRESDGLCIDLCQAVTARSSVAGSAANYLRMVYKRDATLVESACRPSIYARSF
ncbi:hypothetical protein [Paraburkholderia sp. J8-2]|uniref:hypothetical protein n=1 Tax=Paraburkholderia sp. J8-2 TaxID=2805440 RepID=UPI0039F12DCB